MQRTVLVALVMAGCAAAPPADAGVAVNRPPRVLSNQPAQRATWYATTACTSLNPQFSLTVEDLDSDRLRSMWIIDTSAPFFPSRRRAVRGHAPPIEGAVAPEEAASADVDGGRRLRAQHPPARRGDAAGIAAAESGARSDARRKPKRPRLDWATALRRHRSLSRAKSRGASTCGPATAAAAARCAPSSPTGPPPR